MVGTANFSTEARNELLYAKISDKAKMRIFDFMLLKETENLGAEVLNGYCTKLIEHARKIGFRFKRLSDAELERVVEV